MFSNKREIKLQKSTQDMIKNIFCDEFYAAWCIITLNALQEVSNETNLGNLLDMVETPEKLSSIDPKGNEVLLTIANKDPGYVNKALFKNIKLVKARYLFERDNKKEAIALVDANIAKNKAEHIHNRKVFVQKYIQDKDTANLCFEFLTTIEKKTCNSRLIDQLKMISSLENLLAAIEKYFIRNTIINEGVDNFENDLNKRLFPAVKILLENV